MWMVLKTLHALFIPGWLCPPENTRRLAKEGALFYYLFSVSFYISIGWSQVDAMPFSPLKLCRNCMSVVLYDLNPLSHAIKCNTINQWVGPCSNCCRIMGIWRHCCLCWAMKFDAEIKMKVNRLGSMMLHSFYLLMSEGMIWHNLGIIFLLCEVCYAFQSQADQPALVNIQYLACGTIVCTIAKGLSHSTARAEQKGNAALHLYHHGSCESVPTGYHLLDLTPPTHYLDSRLLPDATHLLSMLTGPSILTPPTHYPDIRLLSDAAHLLSC